MKRVLVTGASGFIGRQTIPYLLSAGYKVYALSSQKREFSHVTWIHKNLLEDRTFDALFSEIEPTHLLHLAWQATPGVFWSSDENVLWVQASLDLISSFIKMGGKRLVVAGTCAEYDWSQSSPLSEISLCRPLSLYGACKYALYQILDRLSAKYNLSFAWGRIFHLYGPGEHPNRFIPNLMHKLSLNQIASCTHGNQRRDFMHVEDVAHAFVALLESPLLGAINIASGEPISLKEIGCKIATLFHFSQEKIHWGAVPAPLEEPLELTANTDRLYGKLGFQKKYSLDEGLHSLVDSLLCTRL